MLIGGRVAERMTQVGLSQAELARRVGISQQAIGKLIHGNSRKTTHIVRLARELGTTPAFLEGEVDDPLADAPEMPSLTPDQREWLGYFETMAPADRSALLHIARSLGHAAMPAGTVHAPKHAYRGKDGTA